MSGDCSSSARTIDEKRGASEDLKECPWDSTEDASLPSIVIVLALVSSCSQATALGQEDTRVKEGRTA